MRGSHGGGKGLTWTHREAEAVVSSDSEGCSAQRHHYLWGGVIPIA
jgi:hypothetical protein